jgi:hypothetical protein
LTEPLGFVQALTFSPDGRLLISGSDSALRVWEAASGKQVESFSDGYNPVHAVAVSPDGKSVVAGMEDGNALVWDLSPRGWAPPQRPLSATGLHQLWADLGSSDAQVAYRAIWSLSAVGQEATAFLDQRLEPVPRQKPERIRQLVADLDSDDFAVRQAASQQLARLGRQAERDLRRALAHTDSEEVRRRAQALLTRLDNWTLGDPESLREVRSVWVLERIGTPEARNILKRLAEGVGEARLTQEAKAALR